MKLEEVLLSGQVVRFHACPSVPAKQPLAEHQWNVAMIVLSIVGPEGWKTILHSLVHDVGEYVTGDIPFTVKREVSDECASELSVMEDEAIRGLIGGGMPRLRDGDRTVLKFADMLEGLRHTTRHEVAPYPVGQQWFRALVRLFADGGGPLDCGEYIWDSHAQRNTAFQLFHKVQTELFFEREFIPDTIEKFFTIAEDLVV